MRHTLVKPMLLTVVAVGALCETALATVINVPADQPSIQAGINAAVNGDTVLVAPGNYNEAINFNGKLITVQSSGGADVTIINANGFNTTAVRFTATPGGQSVLQGFTVTGGTGSIDFTNIRVGGGIRVQGSSLQQPATAQILDCKVTGNTVNLQSGNSSCTGGGVFVRHGVAEMRRCLISNNTAIGGGSGGGIAGLGTVRLYECTISENQSSDAGAGMYLDAQGELYNCAIVGNQSTVGAAGIVSFTGTKTLVNCRITGNTSQQSSTSSALFVSCSAQFNLVNCTLANNLITNPQPGAAGGVYVAILGGCDPAGALVNLRNCIVYDNSVLQIGGPGNKTANFSCVEGGFPGAANISSDPLFADASTDDFRLADESPCRDAGDRSLLPADSQDLDGDSNIAESLSRDLDLVRRIVNGQVDMGAYEWQRTCLTDISRSSPGVAGDGVTTIGDLLAVIAGWGPCDQCNADVNNDDVVNITDLLAVIAGWGACQ